MQGGGEQQGTRPKRWSHGTVEAGNMVLESVCILLKKIES